MRVFMFHYEQGPHDEHVEEIIAVNYGQARGIFRREHDWNWKRIGWHNVKYVGSKPLEDIL